MSEGPNSINSFIRGGQYLAHLVQMIGQNIGRGIFICSIIGFLIGSYFYIWKLDGYDKYVLATEFSGVTKASLPIEQNENNSRPIILYSPDGPNQKHAKILIAERRLLPWYEYERSKTLKKLKAAAWLTLLDSLITLVVLSLISQSLGRVITRDKQTRGARKVTKRELIREVRAFNKIESKKMNLSDYKPYEIEGVEYPLRSETQHTLLAGTTGAGKTQLLLRLVKQVTDRNDRAIIYDKMRSFVPMFYNPETDYILNPLDPRCPPWDIFSDARNIVEWNSIADAIIQNESDDPYWSSGAKAIFANTANRLQAQCLAMNTHPTLTDLLFLLTQTTVEELYEFVIGTEAARHLNPKVDKQAASMLSTLSQSITPLGFLKDSTPENPGFSIRRWMADDTLKGKLFLTSRDDQHSTIQPLLTMWMSLCTTSLMSQKRSNNRLCWFFIDELPSLNRLPDLEAGLAQARQYGGAYVLGIQLESQLQETYDIQGAQTIMGLTLNKAIFNPGDAATAKTMADAIGKTELIRRNEGISLGAKRIRDGVNMNSQITQEHIVLPEELMSLSNLNFFLKLRGNMPTAPITLDYIPIETHHEGYIEDINFMDRYNYKMSSATSADAARRIIKTIRDTKASEASQANLDIDRHNRQNVYVAPSTTANPTHTFSMAVVSPKSDRDSNPSIDDLHTNPSHEHNLDSGEGINDDNPSHSSGQQHAFNEVPPPEDPIDGDDFYDPFYDETQDESSSDGDKTRSTKEIRHPIDSYDNRRTKDLQHTNETETSHEVEAKATQTKDMNTKVHSDQSREGGVQQQSHLPTWAHHKDDDRSR